MPEIELSVGIIEYEDTQGPGPVVVLLHGLAMDGSLWRKVVRELRTDHRCVVPTLPNCQAVSSPWSNPCGCAPCAACH